MSFGMLLSLPLACLTLIASAHEEHKEPEAKVLEDAEKFLGKETTKEATKEAMKIKTEKFKRGEPSEGDGIAEHLLGHTTKGVCTSWHIPIPMAPDVKFGSCYDWRNAVCKKGKCRCLKGQELSEDGEFCINPGHCSRETAWGCGNVNILMGQLGDCPGWLEGATCAKNKQCTCPQDSCTYSTTGYWSFKDTMPRCSKPGSKKQYQTCNKMTGGTCLLAAFGHQLVDGLTEGIGSAASKLGGKAASFAAKKVASVATGAIKDAARSMKDHLDSKSHDKEGLASLAGVRAHDMVDPSMFGEAATCSGYRDAICTYPVVPAAVPVVGDGLNALTSMQESVMGGHGSASSVCMCRPTDCTVYSKKHAGLVCVYGPLLTMASEVVQESEITFESVSSSAYTHLAQALYGRGDDIPEDFFEIKNRHMLRKIAEHQECITAMQAGESPDADCQEFVCSFSSAASGHFPRSWWMCRSQESFATGAALCFFVIFIALMAVLYRKQRSTKNASVYADTSYSVCEEQEAQDFQ